MWERMVVWSWMVVYCVHIDGISVVQLLSGSRVDFNLTRQSSRQFLFIVVLSTAAAMRPL